MMSLGAPLALLASAALAVPLLIHLMRRDDDRLVQFAALRYLAERRHPRRQWHLRERLLLALRLLLIAGIVLVLTAPVWYDRGGTRTSWVVLAPGVDVEAAKRSVLDTAGRSATGAAEQWHWLTAGFPPVDSTPPPSAATPVASLLRQLDADLPAGAALTVLVPTELGGLDAERIRTGRTVTWRVLAGASPARTTPPSAVPTPPPALNAPPPAVPGAFNIAVRYDSSGTTELSVARALLAAWRIAGLDFTADIATADVPVTASTSWLIWLGGSMPAELDGWITRGGIALASRASANRGEPVVTDRDGAAVFRTLSRGEGRIVSTTQALTTSAVPALLEPDIARRLRDALAKPIIQPDRARGEDATPVPRSVKVSGPTLPFLPYLALAIAALFLCERLWATRHE